jgi:hypothetical protein
VYGKFLEKNFSRNVENVFFQNSSTPESKPADALNFAPAKALGRKKYCIDRRGEALVVTVALIRDTKIHSLCDFIHENHCCGHVIWSLPPDSWAPRALQLLASELNVAAPGTFRLSAQAPSDACRLWRMAVPVDKVRQSTDGFDYVLSVRLPSGRADSLLTVSASDVPPRFSSSLRAHNLENLERVYGTHDLCLAEVNETVSDLIQEVSRLLTVIHLLSRSVQDILVHSSCATGTTEVAVKRLQLAASSRACPLF